MDAQDFGLVRLETVRRGLPPPIVASEQDDTFVRTDVDGRAVWLPARSEIHQTYEGPGHRTPIHRVVRYDRVEANPPDFAERRRQAHASDAVMMGETPQGFRYLAADPQPAESGGPRAGAPPCARSRWASRSTRTSTACCRSAASATSTSTRSAAARR